MRTYLQAACAAATILTGVRGIDLDINDKNSILSANAITCDNALSFYHGDDYGGTPGLVDQPYYWWEAGGLFGLLIQRWSITGNSSLNDMITTAVQWQVGSDDNFEPLNQTFDLGNDDQLFWAYTALDAAELGFPNPPSNQPSWISLAQAVFNRQTPRWDSSECGGGEHWQVNPTSQTFNYKNTVVNGGYFQLAARLARYTGNTTYVQYAERMFDWIVSTPIYDNTTNPQRVWDGIHIENCSSPTQIDYTYNPATMLVGAAYMYNFTNGSTLWQERVTNLLNATTIFFVKSNGANTPPVLPAAGDIMCEVSCEPSATQTCDQDMPSFKAYTSRWLAMTAVLAPFTRSTIWPRLQASAQGAAGQCIGNGPNQQPGTSCGRRWYQSTWDSFSGLGEQMSAMSVFQSLLIDDAKPPFTQNAGGTSKGNAGAGNGNGGQPDLTAVYTDPVTTGDKAGAAILTIIFCAAAVASSAFLIL